MSTLEPIRLVENGEPAEVALPAGVGAALAASRQLRLVDCVPSVSPGRWVLRPLTNLVGAVAVGPVEIHVDPKICVQRVVYLLGYASGAALRWHDPLVGLQTAPDLLSAVVRTFTRMTERALLQGLLQGYRSYEEALPVVRGRIREADQLRRRHGLLLPVEVRYDDFTVDTAENRWLRAAVLRSLRLPGLDRGMRHRLLRLDLRLADVTAVHSPVLLEPWRATRLNVRLHDALRLAEVIVRCTSFELGAGALAVHGFAVDIARVFESFVCAELAPRLRAHGGTTRPQDPWHLDDAGDVPMRPDLVWYADDGRPAAVVDAKYKAEQPSGFPNADLYQALAYCTVLGLPTGHLVYAAGNEHGRTHVVAGGSEVTIRAHTLDLDRPPVELLRQVDALSDRIAVDADGTVMD